MAQRRTRYSFFKISGGAAAESKAGGDARSDGTMSGGSTSSPVRQPRPHSVAEGGRVPGYAMPTVASRIRLSMSTDKLPEYHLPSCCQRYRPPSPQLVLIKVKRRRSQSIDTSLGHSGGRGSGGARGGSSARQDSALTSGRSSRLDAAPANSFVRSSKGKGRTTPGSLQSPTEPVAGSSFTLRKPIPRAPEKSPGPPNAASAGFTPIGAGKISGSSDGSAMNSAGKNFAMVGSEASAFRGVSGKECSGGLSARAGGAPAVGGNAGKPSRTVSPAVGSRNSEKLVSGNGGVSAVTTHGNAAVARSNAIASSNAAHHIKENQKSSTKASAASNAKDLSSAVANDSSATVAKDSSTTVTKDSSITIAKNSLITVAKDSSATIAKVLSTAVAKNSATPNAKEEATVTKPAPEKTPGGKEDGKEEKKNSKTAGGSVPAKRSKTPVGTPVAPPKSSTAPNLNEKTIEGVSSAATAKTGQLTGISTTKPETKSNKKADKIEGIGKVSVGGSEKATGGAAGAGGGKSGQVEKLSSTVRSSSIQGTSAVKPSPKDEAPKDKINGAVETPTAPPAISKPLPENGAKRPPPSDSTKPDKHGSPAAGSASAPSPVGGAGASPLADSAVEEYRAKLAEKRKVAREKADKEAEEKKLADERQRQEQEARLKREEEEEMRREAEELHMLEEARIAEQERFQRLVEAEEKRKLEEAEKLEMEKREKAERERVAQEEAARLEAERQARMKRDEEEKNERRKRLDNIMKRVKTDDTPTKIDAKVPPFAESPIKSEAPPATPATSAELTENNAKAANSAVDSNRSGSEQTIKETNSEKESEAPHVNGTDSHLSVVAGFATETPDSNPTMIYGSTDNDILPSASQNSFYLPPAPPTNDAPVLGTNRGEPEGALVGETVPGHHEASKEHGAVEGGEILKSAASDEGTSNQVDSGQESGTFFGGDVMNRATLDQGSSGDVLRGEGGQGTTPQPPPAAPTMASLLAPIDEPEVKFKSPLLQQILARRATTNGGVKPSVAPVAPVVPPVALEAVVLETQPETAPTENDRIAPEAESERAATSGDGSGHEVAFRGMAERVGSEGTQEAL